MIHTLKNEIYGCYIYGIWEISDERDLTNDMNSTSGIFPFELKPKLIINDEIHNVTATSDEFGGFTQKDIFLTKNHQNLPKKMLVCCFISQNLPKMLIFCISLKIEPIL